MAQNLILGVNVLGRTTFQVTSFHVPSVLCNRRAVTRGDLINAEAQATVDEALAAGVWKRLDASPQRGYVIKLEQAS